MHGITIFFCATFVISAFISIIHTLDDADEFDFRGIILWSLTTLLLISTLLTAYLPPG